MNSPYARWLPLTGTLFVLLTIVGFLVGGEPPEFTSPPDEIARYYSDNANRVGIAMTILLAAVVALVYFGSYLRAVLDRAEGESGFLTRVVFIGAVVFAVGGAIDGTIAITMIEAADDIEPTQVQTLLALWNNDYLPMLLGIILFHLSAGLSIVRHRSLPAWLGWLAIVVGVAGLVPWGGFVAFPGAALWILIASIVLFLTERKAPAPAGG